MTSFHIIDKKNWDRAIYFDYYFSQIKCKYNITANIDITNLVKIQKENHLKFFPVMLYVQENDRLRNEIKVLQEYKEKAHRELCRVRDEQKTFGKIKVKTKFNL